MRSLVFGCAPAIPRSTARPAAVPPVMSADFRRNSRRAIIPPSSCSARILRRGSVIGPRLLVARQLAVDAPVRLLDVLEPDVKLIGRRLADLHHRVGDRGGDLALLLVGAPCVPLNRDVRHGLSPQGVGFVSIRGWDYRSAPSAGQGSPAGTLWPRAGLTARPNDERGRSRPGGWANDQTETLADAECGSGRRRLGDAGARGPDPSPSWRKCRRGAAGRRRDRRGSRTISRRRQDRRAPHLWRAHGLLAARARRRDLAAHPHA